MQHFLSHYMGFLYDFITYVVHILHFCHCLILLYDFILPLSRLSQSQILSHNTPRRPYLPTHSHSRAADRYTGAVPHSSVVGTPDFSRNRPSTPRSALPSRRRRPVPSRFSPHAVSPVAGGTLYVSKQHCCRQKYSCRGAIAQKVFSRQ